MRKHGCCLFGSMTFWLPICFDVALLLMTATTAIQICVVVVVVVVVLVSQQPVVPLDPLFFWLKSVDVTPPR